VVPSIQGLPDSYEPGKVYKLNLAFEGGPATMTPVAGFDLAVSEGTLIVPAGVTTVRVDPATGDATHTPMGHNRTSWKVQWRAPGEDSGEVTITLVVNAVNGNLVQDPGDQWGRETYTVAEGGKGGIRDAPLFWSVVGGAAIIGIVAVAYLAMRGPRVDLRR
jgi:hypothetical protein